MSEKILAAAKKAALERFPMEQSGIHGLAHWERVRENGELLAKHCKGDKLVIRLFAYLHDCCRENDGSDHEHGLRAALFAATLRDTLLSSLDETQFQLLTYACEHHEKGRGSDNPTVGACWDSDRLDLGRVGRRPNRKFLSTDKARAESVIEWAYKRSRGRAAKLKG